MYSISKGGSNSQVRWTRIPIRADSLPDSSFFVLSTQEAMAEMKRRCGKLIVCSSSGKKGVVHVYFSRGPQHEEYSDTVEEPWFEVRSDKSCDRQAS